MSGPAGANKLQARTRSIAKPVITRLWKIEREGYVPNVLYSCGGLVHEGRFWLPYASSDVRISFASLPLDRQTAEDLLWIREPFLSWRRDLDKVVVHGHTVGADPIVRNNRIGIDTGACWTGCLTCLVLEEGEYRFLSTARPAQPAAAGRQGEGAPARVDGSRQHVR